MDLFAQNLSCFSYIIAFLLFASSDGKFQVGETRSIQISSDSPSHQERTDASKIKNWHINNEGCSFTSIHFSRFHLDPSDELQILDTQGNIASVLTKSGRKGSEGSFWSVHVRSDTLTISMTTNSKESYFEVDEAACGYSDAVVDMSTHRQMLHHDPTQFLHFRQSACGADDRQSSGCIKSTYPNHFYSSRSVSHVLVNGIWACSGFLVSSSGHLITSSECISSPEDARNAVFEFPSMEDDCGSIKPFAVFAGSALLELAQPSGFAVVRVEGNPAQHFPIIELSKTVQLEPSSVLEKEIYIPHFRQSGAPVLGLHSSHPADLALGSDKCHVLGFDSDGHRISISSACDAGQSSSGAPVLLSGPKSSQATYEHGARDSSHLRGKEQGNDAADEEHFENLDLQTHQLVAVHLGGCDSCECRNVALPVWELRHQLCSDASTCNIWGCCAQEGDIEQEGTGKQNERNDAHGAWSPSIYTANKEMCLPKGETCKSDADCCSSKCSGRKQQRCQIGSISTSRKKM